MRTLLLAILLLCLTQTLVVEALFGLAGLVALKAGAVGYALGRGFGGGRRRHHGGYSRGYGHGYSRGHGHGYGGHRSRYGRDVSAQEEDQENVVEAAQLDAYFAAVMIGDEDQCGLKLVCQLHTKDASQLGEDANMILALFGSDVPSSGRPDSPKRVYDEAAALGRSGTVEACVETFSNCSYEAEELLQFISDTPQQ